LSHPAEPLIGVKVTPEYLAKPLTPFPFRLRTGWMLRTIGDAGEYILALSGKRRRLARRLLMKKTSVATMSHVYLNFGAEIIEKFFLLPN
jgi:hypothetical protein